jgi:filamentous hemagglutinin family protein
VVAFLQAFHAPAEALPQGAQVVNGQVVINPGLIQQGSDKAIVNWQSFSIAAGETLRVQQPGINSVLLNRVVGGDPSLILGQLQANGRVFLVNPRGIVFGRGSQVDAGSLVASTLDLSDTSFLAGNYRFSAGPDAGGLQADGSINAPGGTVALVAPQLGVGGSIAARRVGLGAASTVQVDVEGDGLVLFNLRSDDERDVALKFNGRVQAEASAELRAQARGGAAGQVLNMDGIVQARGFSQQGGRIVIDGGTAGITSVNGQADASGETGGSIIVLGKKLALLDAARLDASGRLGGGSLQVGGGFEGQGTAHNAERTWIGAGVELRADATEQGDGGRVAVWSDGRTDMLGSISARGGRLGGNGGSVETSGRQRLNLLGSVDASAPLGRAGQWLLDPNDVVIKSNAGTNTNVGAAPNFSTTDDGAVVDITALNNALTGGTAVTVQTTSSGANTEHGDIDVQGAIASTGTATLNLIATRNISFSTGSVGAGAGPLTLNLQAGGSITGSTLNTGGGTVSATSTGGSIALGSVTSTGLTVSSGGGDVTLPTGTVTGALSVTTAGGAVTQAGALAVTGTTGLSTGAGDITLTAANNLQGAVGITTTGITQIANGAGNALTLGALSTRRLTATTSNAALNLGSGTVTGNLSAATGGGAITQAGALTVTGTTGLDAGAGDITLASANNLQGTVTLTSTGSSQLNNGSHALSLGTLSTAALDLTTSNAAIDLGSGTVAGALTVATGGGAVTQSGALAVTGTSSINAGAGDITLKTAGNNLAGAVSLTSTGTTQVSNGTGNALTLGSLNTHGLTVSTSGGAALDLGQGTVTGNLSATSNGGAITQTGALTVTGTTGLDAGAGNITLGLTNNLQGAVDLTSTGTTQIANGNHALTLGSISTHDLSVSTSNAALNLGSGTVTGTLGVTTAGGAVTQAGALSVTGASSIDAGAGNITLTTAGNNLQGAVGLTSSGSTQISNGNNRNLLLGTLNTGALTVTTNNADVDLGSGTVAGALVVNSGGGNVTQTGALTTTGTASINSGAGDITLTQANNLAGAVSLTTTGVTQVSNGAHALTLGTLSTRALTVGTSNANLNLGSGTVTGNLSVTAGSGAVTQGGALTVTGTTGINAGDITLAQANNLQGTVDLTSSGTTQLGNGAGHALTLGTLSTQALSVSTSAAGLNLGSGTVAGNLVVATAGGTLSQGGALTVTGTTGINSGAGNITLTSANNLQGAVSLTSTGSTQVSNASGNALTLGTLNTHALTVGTSNAALNLGSGTVAGALSASSGGGTISQGGALTVTGTTGLNAGAGDITLTSANNLQGAVNLTSTGTTQLGNGAGNTLTLGTLSTHDLTVSTSAAALNLGSGTVGGNLSVGTNGGAVTQGGALTVTGTTAVTAGAGNITLTSGNNLAGTVNLSSSGSTQVSNGGANALTLGTLSTANLTVSTGGGALNLGGGSVSGTLDASSNGGAISQTGALNVGGIATLDATTSGNISLTNTSNVWHGLNLTGNSLDLRSGSDLEILSLTQPANRALTLSAGGNLILGPAASIDTGSADLLLASLGGSFTMGGVLAGRNVELQAQTGLVLSQNITATGTLKLSTASGDITQTGGSLLAGGATTVSAGASNITLNQATNHFGGAVSLSGAATAVTDSGALTLGTLSTGDLTVTSGGALKLGQGTVNGTLNATSNGFAITQTGGLTLTGATTLDAGSADITLNDATNDLQGAITATAGAVSLRSANNLNLFALTQTPNKGLELEAGGTLILPAGTSNIDTGTEALKLSSGGVFATFGTLKGGDVTLKGQSATLAHDITASGALVVTATGGSINQTGGQISVAGTSSFDAGAQSITLNRPLNDFQGAVTLTGGAAQIVSQNALSLDALHLTGLQAQAGGALLLGTGTLSGNLGATANGAITQAAGGLQVTGTSSLNANGHAITLLDSVNDWTGAVTLNGGATLLKGIGAVLLGGGSVASLDLTAGGAVTQNAGLTVTGALGVNAGSAAITLNHAGNHLNGTTTLTGGATQVRTAGALTLGTLATGALTVQSSGNLNLGQGSVGGNLVASSGGGAVSQAGVLNVTGTADIQAGAGSITLTQGSNAWGGALSLAGGTTQVTSSGSLTLGTLAVGALTVNATGALGLGQGTVGGSLTSNSHGGAITQAGALDVSGAAQLTAGGAAITLNQAGNQWRNVVSLSGGNTQIRSAGALTLGTLATVGLDATSVGALNLGQGMVGGNLNAISGGGAITQSGALQVTGSASFNAGAANITLGNTGNQFLGALSLTGNAVTLFNQPSLVLGTLSFNSLDATSNGSITLGSGTLTGSLVAKALGGTVTQIAGGLSVAGTTTLQATAGITMTEANHLQGVVNLSGGATALSDAGNLRLGSVSTASLTLNATGTLDLGSGSIAGALNATSSGALTQTGALSVSGTSALNAGTAGITLTQAANAFTGAVSLSGGNVSLTNGSGLSLGSLGVADLTVSSSGALQLGAGTVSGALNANSHGGAITQTSGGLHVSGASTLTAGGAAINLTDGGNAFGGLVSLTAGDASLAGSGALRLGSFTAHNLTLSAGGDVDLGGGSVGGDLSATTRGARIGQSAALTVNGSSTFIADGSLVDLVLDQPGNQLLGAIHMNGVNGGSFISADISSALDLSFSGDVQTLKLTSGGLLTLGGGTNTTLTAAAARGIVQTGALKVSGLTTVVAQGAAMPVDLSNAGNDLNRVQLSSQGGGSLGRVQLGEGDAARHDGLKVTGDATTLEIVSAGAVELGGGRYTSLTADTHSAGAAITQSGALAIGGAAVLKAGSGAITLTRSDNSWGGVVQLGGGPVQLTAAGALTLGDIATGSLTVTSAGALNLGQGSVGGELTATSGGSAITQSGALKFSDKATLSAGGADVVLDNAGNQFLGAVTLSARDATLFSQPGLILGIGSLSGTLTARSGGDISQSGGALAVAGGSTLQATGAITLTDAGNQFGGVVNLSGGASALTSAADLRLGSVATAGLTLNASGALDLGSGQVGGELKATSAGTLTQTGALTVSGAATLDAGSAAITLAQAGNAFAGTVNLRGGNTLLSNGGALSLGTLNVADLTVTSGGALQLGTGTVAGDLKATSSGGAISQAAGGLNVAGTTTLDAGAAAIALADPANVFTGSVSLQGGDVDLAALGSLRLGRFTTHDLKLAASGDIDLGSGSVNGALSARAGGTAIGQTGALSVQGASSFIADGSRVALVLDQPGNQLLGPISLGGVNGGSFVSADLRSLQDLSFSGDVQTLNLVSGGLLTLGGGSSTTLTASAGQGLLQTGPLLVSGVATLIASGAALPVNLGNAGNDFNTLRLQTQAGGSFGRVQVRDGDAARHDGLQLSGDATGLEITSAGALDLGGGRYASLAADTSATGAAIKQSGALAIGGLAALKAGAGDITLTRADNALAGIAIDGAGVASLVSTGAYVVNASTVSTRLELGGAGAIGLVGPLSGTGELVMSGSGSLTVSTAQSYAGGTRINSGRLVLQGPTAQAGSGAVQLGAAGELDLRDGASLTNALLAQGGSVLNTSGSGSLAGPVTLQATTSFLPGAGGLTISGAIGDGGAGFGLRLAGGGTLTLSGSNSFSGTTDIAAGTLRATGAGALSSTSAVQLAGGSVLALGQDQTAGSLSGAGRVELASFTLATGADGRDTSFSGSVQGSGGLTKLGSGRFTLAGSGTQTGVTHVAAGELVLASSNALNEVTAVSVDAGATLTVQQSVSLGSLSGAGTVDLQAPRLAVGSNGSSTRWSGAITGSGGLAKRGTGVFTLAGHNTFAGDVSVEAGTLQLEGQGPRRLAAAAPVGPVVPATAGVDVAGGATLELLTDIDLGALTGSGQVQLNAATLTVGASGRSGRFDGVMAGSGGLTKAGSGTLTLGGANLYGGSTRVSGGSLVLDTAQALAGASALVIDAGAEVKANARQAVASLNGSGSLVLSGASLAAGSDGADSRFDGVISGSGGLVKQGAGTLALTAANTQSGATVIEAGAIQLRDKGSLGSGEIQNQGQLLLARADAFTLDQTISGRGSLVITQGQVTLNNDGNSYSGATQVQGGALITTAAERLPDASDLQLAAGAQLQLGGNETIASLQAAGSVRLAGDLTTRGQQVYTGSLTLANAAGLTLSGTLIDASHSANQFAGTPLGLNGGQALVTVKEKLQLGNVTLSNGGRVEAERLALDGKVQLTGGKLDLVATAVPDDAKATLQGTAQVPVSGLPLAYAEATVQQGSSGAITVADGASLAVQAVGGGSVLLAQDANSFKGQLSVLSGGQFNTAWVPNAKGGQSVQSLVHVAGQQVTVGGGGIEADLVHVRADQLATVSDARLVARLPFDEIVLGKALSAPGMTLELAPGAFGIVGSFGSVSGLPIQVEVGSTSTGARTTGPNAGYLTVLPKAGVQGQTAIVLVGPKVGSTAASGGTGYRFFHDGASQATEIPVIYNGVLPLTPAASGAISSINGDAEEARRARFQETVRTENVTVRLRAGVIAEVGPGRPSTQGSEGARPPETCDPALQPVLSCKPNPAP